MAREKKKKIERNSAHVPPERLADGPKSGQRDLRIAGRLSNQKRGTTFNG